MYDKSLDERLIKVAKELHAILSDCVSSNSLATDEQIEEVLKLKREITMVGALVECGYILSVESGEVETVVTIYKVKENLSPEDRKIYDEWFTKVNGLKI